MRGPSGAIQRVSHPLRPRKYGLRPIARCNEVDPYGLALYHAGLDGVYRSGWLFWALLPLLRNRNLIHTLALFKLLTLLIALLWQFGREAEKERIVGDWRATVPDSGR